MAATHLDHISTRAPKDLDKDSAKKELEKNIKDLQALQNVLYASHEYALLVIIQGMDASGKDGLIKDVFASLNPQGVQVTSFKVPTTEEADHDFLWRIHKHTPGKGMLHIFNRSHYEDVLVPRVNQWIDEAEVARRMHSINDFEKLLTTCGRTIVVKLFLHVSHEEQIQRLQERLTNPEKMWKYNAKDFDVSAQWEAYQKAYEDVFDKCNEVPWHIIPTDQNWYKSYLVSKILKETLENLHLKYPVIKEA